MEILHVKKKIQYRPRKEKDKMEITDSIPRRWKESESPSPLKNKDYYKK